MVSWQQHLWLSHHTPVCHTLKQFDGKPTHTFCCAKMYKLLKLFFFFFNIVRLSKYSHNNRSNMWWLVEYWNLLRGICHFDDIFIIGCTKSCHSDNFWCSQWWKFHQNDDISISVLSKTSCSNTFDICDMAIRCDMVIRCDMAIRSHHLWTMSSVTIIRLDKDYYSCYHIQFNQCVMLQALTITLATKLSNQRVILKALGSTRSKHLIWGQPSQLTLNIQSHQITQDTCLRSFYKILYAQPLKHLSFLYHLPLEFFFFLIEPSTWYYPIL